MKRLFIALAVAAAISLLLHFAGPAIQRALFYPKPSELPPVVSQSTEQLLAQLDATLKINAPIVEESLQPGLSEAQITALEAQGGFRLSADLRALYRWHNGMIESRSAELLAGKRFVPLDEAVHAQAIFAQQIASASALQRRFFSAFAGHRTGWLDVLEDGAGDGYFYDPERTDPEGAFFYHFAEDGYYLWFPSLRNFLAGVIECYESRAITLATDGKSIDEDFARTHEIWTRFAKSSEERSTRR